MEDSACDKSEVIIQTRNNEQSQQHVFDDAQLQSSSQTPPRVTNKDGLPVFLQSAPNLLEAANVVLIGAEGDSIHVCNEIPKHFRGRKSSFLIDLDQCLQPVKKVEDLYNDAYGQWRVWGTKEMYFKETGHGDFYAVGKVERRRNGNSAWDLFVQECRLFHPCRDPNGSDSKLTKCVYAVFSDAAQTQISGRWVLIVYERHGEPFEISENIHSKRSSGKTGSNNGSRKCTQGSSGSLVHKRKRRQIYLPLESEIEVEEDELLDLEREKLEREIEILELRKEYLALKMEREQRLAELSVPDQHYLYQQRR